MPTEHQIGFLKGLMVLDITDFEKKAKKVTTTIDTKLKSSYDRNRQRTKTAGIAMAAMGAAALLMFTKASTAAIEFNAALAKVNTVTTEAVTNTAVLKERILGLSVTFAKGLTDVTGGAFEFASAFQEGALQGKAFEINLRAATAGAASATETIKLTSAVTKAYGDISAGAQQKVLDLSFLTVKLGQTTFPELAASMGKVVPLMQAMGGRTEELFAGFATLTGVTGNTAEVSTQLSSILAAMIKPTRTMLGAIKQAGQEHLGLADATGKDLIAQFGLIDTMKKLIATTDGSTISFGKLFRRKEGMTALFALLGGQAEQFTGKLESMENSAGSMDEAFERVTNGVNALGFQMAQADQRMKVAVTRIGDAVTPALLFLKNTIAGVVTAVGNWVKEHPVLTKVILSFTVALAALMVVVGPLLIALPHLAAGFVLVKGAIVGLPALISSVGTGIVSLLPLLGKVAAVGAVAFVAWKIGRLIGEITGLDEVMVDLFDSLNNTVEEATELSMIEMGWTQQGKGALFYRDMLVILGEKIDGNVTGLRSAAIAIKGNAEAYAGLSVEMKRIVDGMTAIKTATANVTAALAAPPIQTAKMLDNIFELLVQSETRAKELTMETTAFKIEQMNQERDAAIDLLIENNATKSQIAIIERTFALEIGQIRTDSAKKEAERQKKANEAWIEAELKRGEEIAAQILKEFEVEKVQGETYLAFLRNIRQQQQDIIFNNMRERGLWREVELEELRLWHVDQEEALLARLDAGKISWGQYQEGLTALQEVETAKREKIEKDAAAESASGIDKALQGFAAFLQKSAQKAQRYFSFITSLNSVWTDNRNQDLDSWYETERAGIESSEMSNEARTIAIEALDAKMFAKKAELEEAAAKREKALAIVQAIINTAVGIAKAIGVAPWPFNIPAITFAALTGAVQIATIGGAYSAPDINSFNPSAGGGEEPVGGGGGAPGGGGGVEPGIPKFATGTDGFISPVPRQFIAGDPGPNQEVVQLAGDLSGVQMAITPVQKSTPAAAGSNEVNLTINITAMDSRDVLDQMGRIKLELAAVIQGLINTGHIRAGR